MPSAQTARWNRFGQAAGADYLKQQRAKAIAASRPAAQIGMSDMLIHSIAHDIDRYTYQQCAHFSIRFFLRQLGVSDRESARVIAEAEPIFEALPIDNRYYRNFAYNDKRLTILPD